MLDLSCHVLASGRSSQHPVQLSLSKQSPNAGVWRIASAGRQVRVLLCAVAIRYCADNPHCALSPGSAAQHRPKVPRGCRNG